MKVDLLRKLIREEVKSAMKEQLQEIMNEAVKAASAPSKPQKVVATEQITKAPVTKGSIDEMLAMTKNQMTSEDYRSIGNFDSSQVPKSNMAGSMASQMNISAGNQPGVDLSAIPGLSKAKQILDAAYKKDKQKAGL
jgi:hypothetical protein